jgi:hypothetical protein
MPFEVIENCNTQAVPTGVVPDGIRVQPRAVSRRKGGTTKFIKVTVGTALARKLVWREESHRIDLAFGAGKDAGKIRASINVSGGQFLAKRDRHGRYAFTINAATAEGLFALDFPAFDLAAIEPVSEIGKPPALVLKASDEMLATD